MVKCDQTDMVFTAYITLRNGNRLYAKQVGKKVFCFPRKEAKEKKPRRYDADASRQRRCVRYGADASDEYQKRV